MTLDRTTAALYEEHAAAWTAAREGKDTGAARRLVARVGTGPSGPLLDVGCGPGYLTEHLPDPVIGLEPVAAFLDILGRRVPQALGVRGEAAYLPFRSGSIGGALVTSVYVHLARGALPSALAELHRVLARDAPVEIVMFGGDLDLEPVEDGEFGPRRYSHWPEDDLRDVIDGAGFVVNEWTTRREHRWPSYEVSLQRASTLPDMVGPGLDVLVCGLNPSVYSADVGVGFGRPGNRFWPAALAADLVSVDRDPSHALLVDGVGMTDLVKRATPRADAISEDEYRRGLARVERLCARLRPKVVCFVGLSGWRAAVDPRAVAGWQPDPLGGAAVYLMPSTSGVNAHVNLDDLVGHLCELRERVPRSRRRSRPRGTEGSTGRDT